jgi:uncharacterized membrane protein
MAAAHTPNTPRVPYLPSVDLLWLAFVVVQALDGVMSYVGLRTLGPWMEANPLVAWHVSAVGPAAALLGAKLIAVACGMVLYFMARHRTLAVLTLAYVVFAVGPWLRVLSA